MLTRWKRNNIGSIGFRSRRRSINGEGRESLPRCYFPESKFEGWNESCPLAMNLEEEGNYGTFRPGSSEKWHSVPGRTDTVN